MSASAPWSKVSADFLGWLDGRLAADVYLNASDDAQAAEIKAWLRQRPEVEAILPGGRADTQWTARRSRFSACPITPPIGIAGRCCNPPQRLDRLRPGDAALISEQLARR
jgi:putative ABC transport system permease protein